MNLLTVKQIQVNVERIVESKFDDDHATVEPDSRTEDSESESRMDGST